jgi:hypothetical protein
MKTAHLEGIFGVHGVKDVCKDVFVYKDQFPRPSRKLRKVLGLPLFHKLHGDAQWCIFAAATLTGLQGPSSQGCVV